MSYTICSFFLFSLTGYKCVCVCVCVCVQAQGFQPLCLLNLVLQPYTSPFTPLSLDFLYVSIILYLFWFVYTFYLFSLVYYFGIYGKHAINLHLSGFPCLPSAHGRHDILPPHISVLIVFKLYYIKYLHNIMCRKRSWQAKHNHINW